MGEMTDIDETSIVTVVGDMVAEVIPLVVVAMEVVARGGHPQDNALGAAEMGRLAPPATPDSAIGPQLPFSRW